MLDFRLLPCCGDDENSSGYSPGVLLLLKADVSERCIGSIFNRWWSHSEHCIGSIFNRWWSHQTSSPAEGDEVWWLHHLLKMEPIQRSETSAFNNNKMPGEYPEKFLSSGQKCFIFVQRGAGSNGSSHTCPPKAPPSPTRPSLSCLNNVPS